MSHSYAELLIIKTRFQAHIRNPQLVYTYIAPKEEPFYAGFMKAVEDTPTLSGTIYEVLVDIDNVHWILKDLDYLEHSELELYMRTNDALGIGLSGTLQQYIDQENIDFEF